MNKLDKLKKDTSLLQSLVNIREEESDTLIRNLKLRIAPHTESKSRKADSNDELAILQSRFRRRRLENSQIPV